MKKALHILFLGTMVFFVIPASAQEITKPDTVLNEDKEIKQIDPPKSEATQEAPKKAETPVDIKGDTLPNKKITPKGGEERMGIDDHGLPSEKPKATNVDKKKEKDKGKNKKDPEKY